jgi:3-dehydroquinate synthase
MAAYKISYYLDFINESVVKEVMRVLQNLDLPVSLPDMDIDKVYDQIFYDKKIKDNKLKFILPRKIGEVFEYTVTDGELIKKVLADLSI